MNGFHRSLIQSGHSCFRFKSLIKLVAQQSKPQHEVMIVVPQQNFDESWLVVGSGSITSLHVSAVMSSGYEGRPRGSFLNGGTSG